MISRHTRDPKRLKLAINADMCLSPLKMQELTGSLTNKRSRQFASTHRGTKHTTCCTSSPAGLDPLLHPAALSIRSCNTCPLKQIINFPTNL